MSTFKTSKARENILGRIRRGLGEHVAPIPFPTVEKAVQQVYIPTDATKEELFADEFIRLGGKFVFCGSEAEMVDNLVLLLEAREWNTTICANERIFKITEQYHPGLLDMANEKAEAQACVTGCEALVARLGSVLISSRQYLGRTANIYTPVHIVVAYIDQVVADLDEALAAMRKKYKEDLPSMLSLATGPSRTADIEKTLVVGVHGPGEVFCFLINKESGFLYK